MQLTPKHWLFPYATALCLYALLLPGLSHAVIEIEVTQGGTNAIPIAIVPFGGNDTTVATDVAQIVADDLQRSGQFEPLDRRDLVARPVSGQAIRYSNWRLSGVDYVVIGGITAVGDGFEIKAQLMDVIQQKLLSAISFQVTTQTLRSASHQIADEVYEKILGLRGAFNTQIAYIAASGPKGAREFKLELSDADGQSPQPMVSSVRPIMSPAWSPDGSRIAYVSFENRERSAIFIQDWRKGSRSKVVSREGINGAPAWSPDGSQLAAVFSDEGSADIYTIDIATGDTRRLTLSESIDTEPVWVNDETIVFTSDRSGGPQLYQVSVNGGRATRITFDGNYNASATVSTDGMFIAFVNGYAGGYRIALINRKTGVFRALTEGSLDESPSFAPNGQMIIYATEQKGKGTLGAVSVDGSIAQSLTLNSGSVREPAWSPFAIN